MTSPAGRPRIREGLTTVEIDGEAVVYDETTGELHHLNPSATIVLSLCDGTRSVDDMATEVSEAFTVAREEVYAQVSAALQSFGEAGLLV
jgi:PqqD family protein of HPr-rel-A system